MTIHIPDLSIPQRMAWLQSAIAPRPICLASTIDQSGNVNLSPFSFFNLFSSNPPIVIFSPARRVRDNTVKHTLENILEVPEVVVNICDYSMAHQVSLSSCEYSKDTDEFVKAGFTKEAAKMVRPPLVKEAKIKLECTVKEVKSLGDQGGAGQLVIAEVHWMHVSDDILNDSRSMIDPLKIPLIARLGGDWYCQANASNLFTIQKPNVKLGIGFDKLPDGILHSKVLTGNYLAQLANMEAIPPVDPSFSDDRLKNIIQYYSIHPDELETELHIYAKELLDQERLEDAWQVLLAAHI